MHSETRRKDSENPAVKTRETPYKKDNRLQDLASSPLSTKLTSPDKGIPAYHFAVYPEKLFEKNPANYFVD